MKLIALFFTLLLSVGSFAGISISPPPAGEPGDKWSDPVTSDIVGSVDGATAVGSATINMGDVHSQSLQSNTDLYISSDGGGISFNNAGSMDFNSISMETLGNMTPATNGGSALGTALLNMGDVHSQSLQSNTDLYISAPAGAGISFNNADVIDFAVGEIEFSNVLISNFAEPKHTADPCGTLGEGIQFYNDTSDYYCFCNGAGVDVKVHDPAAACF